MPVVERRGSVVVVRPEGPLRADTVEQIDGSLQSQLVGGTPSVLMDLSDTPLIDGAGLEWILALNEVCCRRGGCIRLCAVGELCRDLLRITGVGSGIEQCKDLTVGLGSFA